MRGRDLDDDGVRFAERGVARVLRVLGVETRERSRRKRGPRSITRARPCTITPVMWSQSSEYTSTVSASRGLAATLRTLRPFRPEPK